MFWETFQVALAYLKSTREEIFFYRVKQTFSKATSIIKERKSMKAQRRKQFLAESADDGSWRHRLERGMSWKKKKKRAPAVKPCEEEPKPSGDDAGEHDDELMEEMTEPSGASKEKELLQQEDGTIELSVRLMGLLCDGQHTQLQVI